MSKHGYTDFFFDLGVDPSGTPYSSLLTYRDDLVFITEYNQLSYVDVASLQLTPYDSAMPVSRVEKTKLISKLPNGRTVNGVIAITRRFGDVITSFISEVDSAMLSSVVQAATLAAVSIAYFY